MNYIFFLQASTSFNTSAGKKNKFKINSPVMAKVGGHSFWPGVISKPPLNFPPYKGKDKETGCVYWLGGTHDFNWVGLKNIQHYNVKKGRAAANRLKVDKNFVKAVEEMEVFLRTRKLPNPPKPSKGKRPSKGSGAGLPKRARLETREEEQEGEYCIICQKTNDLHSVLLCSFCDGICHVLCLDPPLPEDFDPLHTNLTCTVCKDFFNRTSN
jgi:PWWP domain